MYVSICRVVHAYYTVIEILVLIHVGDQAVCVGDPLPASCLWHPPTRAEPAQEECLPQCQRFIHMDMCTLPGQYSCAKVM